MVVLATVDPFGWPHPALISYAELLALDPARLRLALHAGSRSTRHLRDSARATLVFADPFLTLYVKVEATALPELPRAIAPGATPPEIEVARFELHVRDVLEDRAEGEEAGARLTGGITVEWPGGLEAAVRRHVRLRDVLTR